MTSMDSLELLKSFMKITPTSEDVKYTEGLKKDDSLLEDVEMEELDSQAEQFKKEMPKLSNLFT